MFAQSLILIVENDPYLALDLTSTVEDYDGRVAGPTRDANEALELLASQPISAAIVDWHLSGGDASPVTCWLSERGVPFVIHATGALPASERERHAGVPLLIKPLQPRTILARLLREMRRLHQRPQPSRDAVVA